MNKIKCNPMVTEYTQTIINDYKVLLKKKVPDEIMIDTLDICHFLGEIERLNNIIKTFEAYLDTVLYTYKKDEFSEAKTQLELAKDKLKELKEKE